MAASSSSPSSGGHWQYDVFISFRGEDTRKNFVCHLYRALEQKTIHTFIDSEELEKGNKISELLNAVGESRISVVVLSQNYATSSWCLKELVKIMECEDKKQQIVVPIFYDVDPSDIRKLKKMFGEAFAKHEQNPNLDKEELETWKAALKGITDLSGWDSRQYKDDIELIEKIVGDILEKWIRIPGPCSLANNLVGMDHHIDEVSLRLCRGKNDVGVVGIWGMGGIGKTTIARAVYDKITYQFEHKGFLYNVKEGFAKKGEAQMRGELLSIILKGDVPSADIFNQGFNAILERLGKKKVLVVLDDVETFSQIEALLGDFYSFGVGSRILVTTRDKESLAGVYETYEARCLNHNESLELFMKHAFRTNEPSEEYSDISKRAIEYAQGLPLALKVLGYSLYNKSVRQWEDLLGKIEKIPERKILDVLRTSFEGLDDLQKQIFLDIACLFREWDMDFVTELLKSCGFHPDIGLENLVNRALITTSEFGELDMHDLLQEMGRDIVRQESANEPGKRSRLWRCEDVYPVLTENTATDAVECLTLDLSNSKVELCIHPGAFVRMTKLRLLIIYYSFSSIDQTDEICYGYRSFEDLCPKQLMRWDLEFLSHDLRFLLWHGCPLKSLPSTFVPKNLVKLDMSGSHIQQLWEGIKPLQNLKVVNLSHCQDLVKIPDFTEAINLEKLFLYNCSSLVEVHSSVFALQKLEVLNFAGCKLKELPSSISSLTGLRDLDLGCCTELETLPTSIHKSSLERLNLAGCSNLGKFPEILGIMKELSELCLDGTPIKGLPSSINLLLGIKKLSMRNCRSLEFLTDSICNLAELTHLDLTGCTELKTLSTSIHMRSLQTLNLDGCSNLEKFPEISGIMKELPKLCLRGTAIKGLPSSIDLLQGIKELRMWNCKSLVFLPDSINNLADITHLCLQFCTKLKTLPTSIHMSSLRTLELHGCPNLEKFPEISGIMKELSELCLDWTAIKGLPSSINLLLGIKKLSMRNCRSLEFLTDSICNLAELTHLDLSGCTELKTLSTSIHMRSLQTLNLDGCSNLEKFPEISGIMKELPELCLDGTAIKGLPLSIDQLEGLKHLSMRDCESLEFLPDSICNLADLKHLDLTGCTELKTLPTSIHMRSLQTLNLDGCSNLEKFPEISGIMKELSELCLDRTAIKGLPSSINLLLGIKKLSMRNCKSLVFLPDSFNNLADITHLDLQGCTELKTLPTSIHMSSLRTLKLDGCSNLEKFPEISGIMKELPELCLDGTAIKGLPSSIDLLRGIKELSMKNCKSLVFLPDSINNLADITHLDLQGCTELKTLPTSIHMSSLRTLKLDGCSNLEKFPEISGIMKELSELCLDRTAIKGLPSSINLLLGIEMLSMRNCKSLAFLPDSICNLANLERLDLSGCSALHNLPEKLGDLESLHALDVSDSGIKLLPFSILRLGKLTGDRLSYIGCKEMTAPLSTWPSSMEEYCSYSVLLHLDLSDCNLLELSDGIAHLSSLKSLKLCRNNLESLPVAMNRLVCLTYLELEACKKLKSIPELSNINYIGAHCCTALETVSTQKTAGRSLDFRFSNCFRLLQTNLFRDIVGTHVLHQIFWLVQAYMFRDIVETHLLDQDNHPRLLSCNMCFPGSEIPDWFNHQCRGSSVTAQLPPNWFDHMFLGFAICTVSFFNKADHSDASHRALCYCTFKGNQGDHNFSFHLQDWGFLESDHMFMAYVPWSKFSLARKGELVNKRYYTEATFKVVVQSIGNSKSEHNCMTSCGLRFFHGNYMGMTQPTIHAEGFGAPFFPDQLEIRKSEAEWEAEPSESGEGSGMCQTLEPLSEPGIESEEEEEIMVVAEQGEGRLVLGSVCRCLSLCECNMSLRKREIERDADSVTRVSDNGEISVLGSHSGLVVPNSQSEGKEEREFMGEGSFAGRGLLGPLCSCFYWLGGVWRGNRKVAEAEDFGFPERKND